MIPDRPIRIELLLLIASPNIIATVMLFLYSSIKKAYLLTTSLDLQSAGRDYELNQVCWQVPWGRNHLFLYPVCLSKHPQRFFVMLCTELKLDKLLLEELSYCDCLITREPCSNTAPCSHTLYYIALVPRL